MAESSTSTSRGGPLKRTTQGLSRFVQKLAGSPSNTNIATLSQFEEIRSRSPDTRSPAGQSPVEERTTVFDAPDTPTPTSKLHKSHETTAGELVAAPQISTTPLDEPETPTAPPPSLSTNSLTIPRLSFGSSASPTDDSNPSEPVVTNTRIRTVSKEALPRPGSMNLANSRKDGSTVALSNAVAGGIGGEWDASRDARGSNTSWGKLTSISKWGVGGTPAVGALDKGKGRRYSPAASEASSDVELSPLDDDEGVVVDDEACFVDGWEGKVDFISSFPHEISLYILLHLPLQSLVASTGVSHVWRQLALDNLVWRDLFHREKRWRVREDVDEEEEVRPEATGSATPSRRGSGAGRRSANTSGGEGPVSSTRLGKRLSDMMSELGGLSLTPMSSERRRNLSNNPSQPTITDVDESATDSDDQTTFTYTASTPRRPASGSTAAPFSVIPSSQSISRTPSSSAIVNLNYDLSASAPSSSGPSRRISSATLSPLGPVPSPSLGWTPSAPLFLDWPKLYHDRYILEQRWEKGQPKSRSLKGHTDSVYCLQFDENKIMTGSRDKTIRVWDTRTGKCLKVLAGHSASVLCLQYDSQVLVSGSSDCRILVWDIVGEPGTGAKKWEVKMSLLGHTMGVLDLCFDDQWIVSCSKDTTIRVWHKATGELYRCLAGHRGPVNAVQLLNNKIVSASGDSFMKLWDVLTGEVIRIYSGHQRGLACVQYSPSGKIIASGSNDQLIKIWDAETGECLRTLEGHTDLVRTLAFDETRGRLVSGSYDRTIREWDLDTGEPLLTFKAHSSLVFDVAFSASKILSCSHDQKIVILDFGTGLDVSRFL